MKTRSKYINLLFAITTSYATFVQAVLISDLPHYIAQHQNRLAQSIICSIPKESLSSPKIFPKNLPLNVAISFGNMDIIPDLIAAGADPNKTDRTGSPLEIAAKQGNVYVMELLAQNGAVFNPEIVDLALKTVEEKKSRLLWPGVTFKVDGDHTQEERILTVKQKILQIAEQKKAV